MLYAIFVCVEYMWVVYVSVWYVCVCACCMDVCVYVVYVVYAYIRTQVHTQPEDVRCPLVISALFPGGRVSHWSQSEAASQQAPLILLSLPHGTGIIHLLTWVLGWKLMLTRWVLPHTGPSPAPFLEWMNEAQGVPDLVTVLTDGKEETGCRNNMGLTPLFPVRESRLWELISVTLIPTVHAMQLMALDDSRATGISLGKTCTAHWTHLLCMTYLCLGTGSAVTVWCRFQQHAWQNFLR